MSYKGAKRRRKQPGSSVFSEQELEVFNQVFERLAKGDNQIPLSLYVDYIKDFSQNSAGSVMSMIVKDLDNDRDQLVNFEEFVAILEEKVGDIKTTSGLQKIFSFITFDENREVATIADLRRIRDELGLTVSDKDLQKLVNFITATYNQNDTFTFEQFEDYVFKTHPRN